VEVRVTSYTAAAAVEDWRRHAEAQVEVRSWWTSRKPAARLWTCPGPVAERQELGLGDQESTLHCWTGTICQAAPLACSDWSEERDVRRSWLDWVECHGDDGKPGRTGSRPRCAVSRALT
jgi:hypothetical protein